MPAQYLRIAGADAATSRAVRRSLADLRRQMEIPDDFTPEVLADAERAAARGPALATAGPEREDLRAVPFLTIDPPGSMDLDQAMALERVAGPDGAGSGFVVHYAIADVAAFVEPGGPVDTESHVRGTTLYGPDGRTPLHPATLSESAASLLPDAERPAVVWRIVLDARGEIVGGAADAAGSPGVTVRRGVVRSVARLSYEEAQAALDGRAPSSAGETLTLLKEIGTLRQELERERGGVSLDVPEQVAVTHDDGTTTLELRSTLPVEGWNAQVSLLTGIAAARVMRAGGVGILRTLPPADPRDVARLRRTARALGIEWPEDQPYGELLRTLDSAQPHHAAFLTEATSLFRGASYLAFGGTDLPAVSELPGASDGPAASDDPADRVVTRHAAIAAEYAHVTAPLRRLVDRYGTEACLAACSGDPVPDWVLDGLAGLPKIMARTGQKAGSYERACLDTVEAALVADRVGDVFDGVVVDVDDEPAKSADASDPADGAGEPGQGGERGQVVVAKPALRASVTGAALPLGEPVRVRLTEASVEEHRIAFVLAEGDAPNADEGRG
ncbi:RNB domain-containing ribonuclease [Luteimicrobium xylanilyticum]|uniref:Exoribonuclease n=1 Tax=Luteimicrobium xylanilyticum TaxID=1133546 RepID=A0A5P9QDR2_9MICO|nr:RNB domain-containing ribonuclease [Luteimicrobium xylanilyticum]QFU99613.1 Exoribonuclease [Luteimicrobium xylanilyticum]